MSKDDLTSVASGKPGRRQWEPGRIVLIQDTREQLGWMNLFESRCIDGTLAVGDYSVLGLETQVGVERKSLPDLIGSLTKGRERFERELTKARGYQRFFVLIEGDARDILSGNYGRSQANPKSIWESIAALSVRFCPFIFAGDRGTAARMCESLLLKFCRENYRNIEKMEKAQRALAKAV